MFNNYCKLHPKMEYEYICLMQHNCQRKICSQCLKQHQESKINLQYLPVKMFFEKSIECFSTLKYYDELAAQRKELKQKISECEKIYSIIHKNILKSAKNLFKQQMRQELNFHNMYNKIKEQNLEAFSNQELEDLMSVELSDQLQISNVHTLTSKEKISQTVYRIQVQLKNILQQIVSDLSFESLLDKTQSEFSFDKEKKINQQEKNVSKLLKNQQKLKGQHHSEIIYQLIQPEWPKEKYNSKPKIELQPKSQEQPHTQKGQNIQNQKQKENEQNKQLKSHQQPQQNSKILKPSELPKEQPKSIQLKQHNPEDQSVNNVEENDEFFENSIILLEQKYEMTDLSYEDENRADRLAQYLDEEDALKQLPLIIPESLNQINKYLKSTKSSKSIPIQTKEFNQYDSIVTLFQEFIKKDEVYFLDFEDTTQLLQVIQQARKNDYAQFKIEEIKNNAIKEYQFNDEINLGQHKMYFPFNDDNPFKFYMIEKDPVQEKLILYFEKYPNQNFLENELQQFLDIFKKLFDCEDFIVSEMILSYQAQKLFAQLGKDEIYTEYLLTLFTTLYEQKNPFDIIINEDTIFRAYQILHQTNKFYALLYDNEEQVRIAFEEILIEGQKIEPYIGLAQLKEIYNPSGVQSLKQQIQMIYTGFLENQTFRQYFLSVELFIPQQKQNYAFYIHISRSAQLNFIKIFSLQNYGQIGQQILYLFLTDENLFKQIVYLDYSRHNMFQEYSEITLAAWFHLATKKNLKAEEAMANLVFSMVPFYCIQQKSQYFLQLKNK